MRRPRPFLLFAFGVMRAVWPVARIGRLVIVTRYDDVRAALDDRGRFLAPFEPEMRAITGGEIRAWPRCRRARRQRDLSKGRHARRCGYDRIDADFTEALLRGSGGRIDAMRDLLGASSPRPAAAISGSTSTIRTPSSTAAWRSRR